VTPALMERRPGPPPFAGDPEADWHQTELPAYHPAHDPAFMSDVIDIVLARRGEWCHPGRILLERRGGACDCHELGDYTHYAVKQARRIGLQIDGDKARGYRFVRFCYITRVRPDDVLAWPPDELPGQLTLSVVGE